MNRPSQRHLLGILAVIVCGLLVISITGQEMLWPVLLLVLVACLTIVLSATDTPQTVKALEALRGSIRRAREGDDPVWPSDVPASITALYEPLGELRTALITLRRQIDTRSDAAQQAMRAVSDTVRALSTEIYSQVQAADDTADHLKTLFDEQRNTGHQIESLTTSAEELTASVLEMVSTTQGVAENIADLGASVRETVQSIVQMASSTKEVAKNVDALAMTADETSSSMKEMDVSIDHVQSNANETARLSEEVAQDAERGAEAILKTIGEIFRIKESSQEAVSVISTLASRIDAIGQILNVIDEVAEQTNLLALNAAIIAAQAGEHGKGFAVVANEIKDLAERAGASTKEIADLIKTIQNESRNAISAVQRGAQNVDRGVEVSNEAERALKKILESSRQSTTMVRAIARATVEQAQGSRQVTGAIGRIAEAAQQIAVATSQQARGSELIMSSSERMRAISQQVERSSQEQARGGRHISESIASINERVRQLNSVQQVMALKSEKALEAAVKIEGVVRREDALLRDLRAGTETLGPLVQFKPEA